MESKCCICVLPGNERQSALSRILAARGYEVAGEECVDGASAVVLPRAATCVLRSRVREGAKNAVIFAWEPVGDFESGGCRVVLFGSDRDLLWRNALLTAEGALFCAMAKLPRAVRGSRVLVFGSGRVATAVADAFSAVGAFVTVAARRAGFMNAVPIGDADLNVDVIVNTVPARIIDADAIPSGTLVLDVSSDPYGFDIARAQRRGVDALRLPSLPARYAPESAASILADVVEREIGGVL